MVTIAQKTRLGAVALLVSVASLLACGSDKAVAPPEESPQIDVRFVSTDVPEALKSAVAEAQARWSRALSKDLGSFPLNVPANACVSGAPALNETHPNLLILISFFPIDGQQRQLAATKICGVSSRDALPVLSAIRIDSEDFDSMVAEGVLTAVIMHEMGHALGFVPQSYLTKGLAGGGTNDPYFQGTTARSEFAAHGAWYTAVAVPLEDVRGTGPNDPHWRFSVFADELMSSFLIHGFRSPLSTITLGFFKDLGYDVDFSVADAYEVIPPSAGNRILPGYNLVGDVGLTLPPKSVTPLITH